MSIQYGTVWQGFQYLGQQIHGRPAFGTNPKALQAYILGRPLGSLKIFPCWFIGIHLH